MVTDKPSTKERIAIRLILFAVKIVLGYSMNDDLNKMKTEIEKELV